MSCKVKQSNQFRVGELYGSLGQLLLIRETTVVSSGRNRRKLVVECQLCKQDSELHGSAIYTVDPGYLLNNKLPCGCSSVTKWTKEQWVVLLSRKAKCNNHSFVDFHEQFKDNNSKIKLLCHTCSGVWTSCSIQNYMRDRGCPYCRNKSIGIRKSKSEEYYIGRFRNTGLFPEENYNFIRNTERGRCWTVHCNICNADFTADRANLVAGKIPCNCGTGGGYDVLKKGYFYILKVRINNKTITKFGVSNFPKRRITYHKWVLKENEILNSLFFTGNGSEILSFESELKRTLTIENQHIDGFRSECCSIDSHDFIVQQATLRFTPVDNPVI